MFWILFVKKWNKIIFFVDFFDLYKIIIWFGFNVGEIDKLRMILWKKIVFLFGLLLVDLGEWFGEEGGRGGMIFWVKWIVYGRKVNRVSKNICLF